ncbi:MAG: hypothetical protein PHR44_03085 [Candidatus Omnitrophica bacterium]|nr:hypothetical protein [Candidatus Omnitrophota bacterium]
MRDRKLIALVVLGVAAVFSLIYGIVTPSRARRAAARQDKGAGSVEEIETRQRYKRTAFASWGRNPFTLTKAPAQVYQGIVLKGIIRDARGSLAVINDVIAGVGDKVGANTVIEIKEDRVILDGSAGKFELELEQ